jgi:hypothetical protein
MVDVEADTTSGVTVTGCVCVIATPPIVTETVLVPVAVELRVPVATPTPSVMSDGVMLLPVPVAENTTLALGIGLFNESWAVTVIVDWLAPLLAVTLPGEALTVERELDTPPGATVNPVLVVVRAPDVARSV